MFAIGLANKMYSVDYTNSIGMVFKDIPVGSFYRRSCQLDRKRKFMGLSADVLPQHKVHISKRFQMGIYEVTVGEFKRFISAARRDDLLTDNFIEHNDRGDNHPVVKVSWEDAQDFINWLNKKEGSNAYRLPTEAEWEYAARAGTRSKFSWGNSESQTDDYAWYGDNSGGRTHAVGGKKANPWGLYDMHGNVWEWVQDWYDSDYYANSPATDPQGPSLGASRVTRGGGWFDSAGDLRSAFRIYGSPSIRRSLLGFRLARHALAAVQ